MNKRGLSLIITTLILIVLVLVAVGIIWFVVKNVISGGTKGIAIGKFIVDAEIQNVDIDNSTNNVSLTVKRNPGKGDIIGMKFIFYDGINSEIITEEEITLKELESKRFSFHLVDLDVNNLIRISIVPIFRTAAGEETMGNVVDVYDVKGGESIGPPSGPVCGDGLCEVSENCPQDSVSCSDNICYEPTCTNGCSESLVSVRGNDESCLSPSMCDGSGNCVECIDVNDCNVGDCVSGSCVVTGNVWYVDYENGDDNAAGTSEGTAWKHVPGDDNAVGNPALATLQAGDTVKFKGGVIYNGRIDADWSGTAGNEIIYISGHLGATPWGTGRAVIDGSSVTIDQPSGYTGVFSLRDRSNIKIEGFEITNFPNCIGGEGYCGGIGWIGSSGGYITIDNCYIYGGGENGIMLQGLWNAGTNPSSFTIINSQIYNNKWHGIQVRGGVDNISIEYNTIHHNGQNGGDGNGIFIGAGGTAFSNGIIIRGNIIYDSITKGMTNIGGHNITVENNYFYNSDTQSSFGVAISTEFYQPGMSTENVIIKNNIIDINTVYEGGIRIQHPVLNNDLTMNNIKIYNNYIRQRGPYYSVWARKGTSTANPCISNIDIKNNILVANPGGNYVIYIRDDTVKDGFQSDYNHFNWDSGTDHFYWGSAGPRTLIEWQALGFDTFPHTQNTNPMFTNPNDILGPDGILWTADDGLIPQQSSPLCNSGEGGSDIGPYECTP